MKKPDKKKIALRLSLDREVTDKDVLVELHMWLGDKHYSKGMFIREEELDNVVLTEDRFKSLAKSGIISLRHYWKVLK